MYLILMHLEKEAILTNTLLKIQTFFALTPEEFEKEKRVV